MNMKKINNQRGFSLIELMVVVAIIGILSAIAIPNFNRFQRKARQSEGKTSLGGVYQASKAFHAEYETYYGDLVSIGFSADGRLRYTGRFSGLGGDAMLVPLIQGPMTGILTITNLCANATYGTQCTMHPLAPAPAGGGVPTRTTFLFQVDGQIGGAAVDRWTINEAKTMLNTQDGVGGS